MCGGRGGARDRRHTHQNEVDRRSNQRAAQSRPNTSGTPQEAGIMHHSWPESNLPSVCPKKHATCTYENTHTYPEPSTEPRRGDTTPTRASFRATTRGARETQKIDQDLFYLYMHVLRSHIRKGSRVPARRSAARGRVCACGRETGPSARSSARRNSLTVAVSQLTILTCTPPAPCP